MPLNDFCGTISKRLPFKGTRMVRYDPRFGRVWRRLIGIILSYAVAFQIFLVGVAGVAVSANAATEDGLSVFGLCLNSTQNDPNGPTSPLGHRGNTHCVFCSAGADHSLCPPSELIFHRINIGIKNAWCPIGYWHLRSALKYSDALPRGPPLSA